MYEEPNDGSNQYHPKAKPDFNPSAAPQDQELKFGYDWECKK
jgi:hypothetical protein